MKILTIAVAALAVLTGASLATSSMAASTMAAKPAAKATMAKAAPAAGPLYCQLSKTDTNVIVQVVNKGTTDVAPGTVFDFTVIGPKTKTAESYKLNWALGPKESLNVTKPMPAASVTGCAPAAA